jgi:quercetin dioxygenase-like cupin family protein
MTETSHPMKIRSMELPVDKGLERERGWEGLEVRWLIHADSVGAEQTVVGLSIFPPGAKHNLHRHPNAEEWEYVLEGRGIKRIGDDDIEIGPGDVVFAPRDTYHGLANPEGSGETLITLWGYCGAASLDAAGYVLPKDDPESDQPHDWPSS